MAKTPVKLIVKGLSQEEREVATYKLTFNQATDAEGQVTGLPRGGKITMRVKALNNGNSDLVRWMADKKLALSGSIVFENSTNGKIMKTVEFEDAYCVSFTEYWEDTISAILLAHYEEITISCRKITDSCGLDFSNTWEIIL